MDEIKSYYIENTKFNRIALAQVYEILMEYEDGIESVPENMIRFLEDNMDKDYIFEYDDLENVKLEKDAENLIIYIYTKYLATDEERMIIENMAKSQKEQNEKEKQDKYKKDVFENSNNRSKNEMRRSINPEELPVEYKESIFKKIVKFFTEKFKRN